MIDLHSHILPGIDDGSADPQMSAALLAMLEAQGVDTVVATPHFYPVHDNPEDFLARRAAAFDKLPVTKVKVLPGAEVAYFDNMSRSDSLRQLCLGNSRLLLVEMPYASWTERMIREVCELTGQQGVQPVLAHVDRYRDQFDKYWEMLAQQGVLFQFNADAFVGWKNSRWALKHMRQGLVHFVGSDCHNLTARPPKMDVAAATITKKLGKDALPALMAFSRQMLEEA